MKTPRQLVDESATPLDIVDAAAEVDAHYASVRLAMVQFLLQAAENLMLAIGAADEIEEQIPPLVRDAETEFRDWLRNLGHEVETDDD
jgi:hypothetical protein